MIGDIFQHDFMIKISICETFDLAKRVFSGSGQMPLNTLQCPTALRASQGHRRNRSWWSREFVSDTKQIFGKIQKGNIS